jgi:hypothetical protein
MGFKDTIANLFGGSSRLTSAPTFDSQLKTFQELGFTLHDGVELSDLDRWGGREAFEQEPFKLMYITLGGTLEREPFSPLCDRCWHFDTEAIEDHGSYVEIMRNLARVSRGAISFDELEDFVDIEEEKASVSFTLGGKRYDWDLAVDDDWVDPSLFSRVVELTEQLGLAGRFTYFDTGGQDLVIGFETAEDLDRLIARTGLTIVGLS